MSSLRPLRRPPTAQTITRAGPVMGLPMASVWSLPLVDMGVTEPHTNAKAPTHHRGSTEEEGGRSKPCFPCATNDAACDGSWTRAIDGSVLQRRSSAGRRDLLLQAT